MNYLFLSGADNTGKTFDLIQLEAGLLFFYDRINYEPTYHGDFISLLKNKIDGRYILVNSASDNQTSLSDLQKFSQTHCADKKINTTITSLREDTEPIRADFLNYFNISQSDPIVDIPMGRPRSMPHRQISRSFLTNTTLILIEHLLRLSPFNLI